MAWCARTLAALHRKKGTALKPLPVHFITMRVICQNSKPLFISLLRWTKLLLLATPTVMPSVKAIGVWIAYHYKVAVGDIRAIQVRGGHRRWRRQTQCGVARITVLRRRSDHSGCISSGTLQEGQYVAENIPDSWPQQHQRSGNHYSHQHQDESIFHEPLTTCMRANSFHGLFPLDNIRSAVVQKKCGPVVGNVPMLVAEMPR